MKVMDEHSSKIEEPDDRVLQKRLMAISAYFLFSTGSIMCSTEQVEASILKIRLPHQGAASEQTEKSDGEKEKERALSVMLIVALTAVYFKMRIEQTSASK